MNTFSFYLVTDLHYYDPSFKSDGLAYEARSRSDQKCIAETPAIIDKCFSLLADDKDTEVILIPGDLVYRGEYQSHIGIRQKMYELKERGKKIYLITARHDYAENPCEFEGDKMIPVKGMDRSELRDFYRDFGFDSAISEHSETMSYVARIADGIRLLALNCDGDCKDFKGLYPSQLEWAVNEIKKAKNAGDYIFAMTHYPLLPFSPVMEFIDDTHLTDWQKTADILADAGLDLIFTGHMHAQAVTDYTTKNGNKITDVQTGCIVGCPCAYRKVTFNNNLADITSYTLDSFDYDTGGLGAQDYLKRRFNTVITDIIDAMAYDFDAFCARFGGTKGKEKLELPVKFAGGLLNRLTVGRLGKMLMFKVDKSLEHVLVKDIGVELARNIFVGNEPYVRGTPVYNAMSKLMDRLSPITKIIEKKAGESNPLFADLKGFVLSLIGDELQRDYNTVIKINRK